MREAVIVSTARTPIGKAYRGAFNATPSATLAGHAIKHAVLRAGIEGGEVEDVIMGCSLQQGVSGLNIGRLASLRAGLPVQVSGMSIDRQCGSGLMAIATAAKQIIVDGVTIAVAGGVESISMVQNEHLRIEPDMELFAIKRPCTCRWSRLRISLPGGMVLAEMNAMSTLFYRKYGLRQLRKVIYLTTRLCPSPP